MRRQVLAVVILHDGRMSASERTSERASKQASEYYIVSHMYIVDPLIGQMSRAENG